MADFTITIRNKLTPVGMGEPSYWNAKNWNAFTWGSGGIFTETIHLISVSLAPSETNIKYIEKLLSLSTSLSDDTTAESFHLISNSFFTIDTDASFERLGDGSGYYYDFPSNTENAGNRAIASYTSASPGSTSYSSLTAGSTVWS